MSAMHNSQQFITNPSGVNGGGGGGANSSSSSNNNNNSSNSNNNKHQPSTATTITTTTTTTTTTITTPITTANVAAANTNNTPRSCNNVKAEKRPAPAVIYQTDPSLKRSQQQTQQLRLHHQQQQQQQQQHHNHLQQQPQHQQHNKNKSTSVRENLPSIKVVYPFMLVENLEKKDYSACVDSLDEYSKSVFTNLKSGATQDSRCELMDRFINVTFKEYGDCSDEVALSNIGFLIANAIQKDFVVKTFPRNSEDADCYEDSLNYPFYVLCRACFRDKESEMVKYSTTLLNCVLKYYKATGFLILYYLKVNNRPSSASTTTCHDYIEFCKMANRELPKCLHSDLQMACTYDSELFCYLLPMIYGDFSIFPSLKLIGNKELIKLTVTNIDATSLHHLICLSFTGNTKIIAKDDILSLIETSLDWESWAQYCLWKLISAHNIPIDYYAQILSKLNFKAHSEALSCILLNLQKETSPSENLVLAVLSYNPKDIHDHFVTSILRFWSMKTDVERLSKIITSALSSVGLTVKRKTSQFNATAKGASNNSLAGGSKGELILSHLNFTRRRAPKSKLFAQSDLLDAISQIEENCSEVQRRKFCDLFAHKSNAFKKQKKNNE